MQNSRLEHIQSRCSWLEDIISSKVLKTDAHRKAISSMRDFVELAIEKQFPKISYNTLKRHARSFPINNNTAYRDYWDLLLSLREEASTVIFEATDKSKHQLPANDELVKQSLLHAHLCSMAYLEIFNHLEQLTLDENSLNEQALFMTKRFLKQARIKFGHIINADAPSATPELTVILGGKPR